MSHSEYRSVPRDDLAQALADDLERSNLFDQVAFVDEVSFADASRRADFDSYFSGTIRSLRYRGGRMTYFLSVFGPVLWVFGVPSAYSINELDVELALRSAYDDKVVWRGSNFDSSDARVMGIYYGQDEEFDGYPRLMAQACTSWIHELRLAARRSPRSFHPFPRVGWEKVTAALEK